MIMENDNLSKYYRVNFVIFGFRKSSWLSSDGRLMAEICTTHRVFKTYPVKCIKTGTEKRHVLDEIGLCSFFSYSMDVEHILFSFGLDTCIFQC